MLHILEDATAVIYRSPYQYTGKAKIMSINQEEQIKAISNTLLKKIKQFTYIASLIALSEKDVQAWIAKAWGALKGLSTIWNIAREHEAWFLQSNCWVCLFYSSSTWTLTTLPKDCILSLWLVHHFTLHFILNINNWLTITWHNT